MSQFQTENEEPKGQPKDSTKSPIPNLILTDSEIRDSRRFVEELFKEKGLKNPASHEADVKT